ncbi:MAG: SUMF1/EgtB/PvdO family nonheme iron enzyme [Myxococcales bacterium]|nr:SUMF1/EgtB/PvdO family nonheme iron enzyme [Myxococcales bacterium]
MKSKHAFLVVVIAVVFTGACNLLSDDPNALDADTADIDAGDIGDIGDVDDSDTPDLTPSSRNACGGSSALRYRGTAHAPGDRCGCTGTLVCAGLDALRCTNDVGNNACGGCGELAGVPGEECGPCGGGTWQCEAGAVSCVGAPALNLCGGCTELAGAPGAPCDDSVESRWECADDSVTCVAPEKNVCGGTGPLEFEGLEAKPGEECEGACGAGRLICDPETRALFCDAPGANGCGGCGPLSGAVGGSCGCGGSGRWVCDGEDVSCDGGVTNPCGGCSALAAPPGNPCAGGGTRICVSPTVTACVAVSGLSNACGGEASLTSLPGSACGSCDSGTVACDGTDAVACEGDLGRAAFNVCGGCDGLVGEVGDRCGTCGEGALDCAGSDALVCDGTTGGAAANACGGCGPLAHDPDTECGVCAAWRCVGGGLQCLADPGAPGCGSSRVRCADLDCDSEHRRCVEATPMVDATCGACVDEYSEVDGVCEPDPGARTPVVSTSEVSTETLGVTDVVIEGAITDLGDPAPTQHGFCRGARANPAIGGSGVTCSTLGAPAAAGPFTEGVTGLTGGTTYHVRAYATNEAGTAYGESRRFTTPVSSCGDGLVTGSEDCDGDLAGRSCTELDYVAGELACDADCHFDTSACLTQLCGDDVVSGTEECDGAVPAGVTCTSLGFESGTPSCSRGCTIDSSGCVRLPAVTTAVVASGTITSTSALVSGNVTNLGVPNPTQHGFCRGSSTNPAVGGSGVVCSTLGARTTTGAFSDTISGLTPATTYFVRAYATNAAGTAYGTSRSFTTASAALLVLGTECSADSQCASGLCSTDASETTNRRCVPRELAGAGGGPMEFRYVPATGSGGFIQGSPGGELGHDSDETQWRSTITRAYFVGRTEVTQGQWKEATDGANPSCYQTTSGGSCSATNANDGGPVEQVDWWAAAAYANWLSDQAGLPRCYTFTPSDWDRTVSNWSGGNSGIGTAPDGVVIAGPACAGYRLLTESEWEWAARGPVGAGTLTSAYYWGAAVDEAYLWYGSNSGGRTRAVGGKLPNGYGLADMSGNVWEWTSDGYTNYPASAAEDHWVQAAGSGRVNRGGAYETPAQYPRSASRNLVDPDLGASNSGFRLARTVSVAPCGDGIVSGSEQCDSGVGGATCDSSSFVGGELRCDADCRFETSACLTQLCGDDVVSGTEECDGSVPAGVTCASLGFTSGTPSCSRSCTIDSSGCVRLPAVTTAAVAAGTITSTSALVAGNVTNLGAPNPTQHGFCRGPSANPAVGGSGVVCSTLGARTSTGSFNETISGLTPGTTYFVRAYATNAAGTAYGASRSFSTPPALLALGTACTSSAECDSGLCSTDEVASTNRRCAPSELPAAAGGAMEFRYIPATGTGGFTQGSPLTEADRSGDELQWQSTITRAYFISRTEVTQGQWKVATGGTNPSWNPDDSRPVEMVDWWTVAAFANWLSEQAGLERCYTFTPANWDRDVLNWADGEGADEVTGIAWSGASCAGYRLPTESEWEWAARGPVAGGSLTTPWYWGSTFNPSYAWYSGNSASGTNPVGTKLANAYGLRDMSGNVYEWVWDLYGAYPLINRVDYAGPSTGDGRCNRGGGWVFGAEVTRSAQRQYGDPANRFVDQGFRLARTAL